MKIPRYERPRTIKKDTRAGDRLESAIGVSPVFELENYDTYVGTVAGMRATAFRSKEVPRSIERIISRLRDRFGQIDVHQKEEFIDKIVEICSFDATMEQQNKAWNEILQIKEIGPIIRDLDSLLKTKLNDEQRIEVVKDTIRLTISDLNKTQENLEHVLKTANEEVIESVFAGIQTIYLCRLCLAHALRRVEKKGAVGVDVINLQFWVLVTLARFDSYRRGKISDFIVFHDLYWLYRSIKEDDLSELNQLAKYVDNSD